MSIPKVIHYCWFGNKQLSEMAKKCIASWKKQCPDYKIIEWNEENFDINCNTYVKEAYREKKWAFVSDVARLHALVNYGGIYMDTDVEVLKSLNVILNNEAIIGFECDSRIQTGFMACVKGHSVFNDFLHMYEQEKFINEDGSMNTITNVVRLTEICVNLGLKLNGEQQLVNGMTILPSEYLSPKNVETGKITVTDKTLCIHYFDGSWLSEEARVQMELERKMRKFLPNSCVGYVAKCISIMKVNGVSVVVKEVGKWIKKRIQKY